MTAEREQEISSKLEKWCRDNFCRFTENQFNAVLKMQACTEFFQCLRDIGFMNSDDKSIDRHEYEEWRDEYMFLWEEFQGWCVDALRGKL